MKSMPILDPLTPTQSISAAPAKGVKPTPSLPAGKSGPAALLAAQSPDPPVRAVVLEYFAPTAAEVFVAGTFNDWAPRAAPMIKQPGGKWSTQLTLKPGTYEYRLIVDGQWQADPMAARSTVNPFGGLNSVLEVKPFKA